MRDKDTKLLEECYEGVLKESLPSLVGMHRLSSQAARRRRSGSSFGSDSGTPGETTAAGRAFGERQKQRAVERGKYLDSLEAAGQFECPHCKKPTSKEDAVKYFPSKFSPGSGYHKLYSQEVCPSCLQRAEQQLKDETSQRTSGAIANLKKHYGVKESLEEVCEEVICENMLGYGLALKGLKAGLEGMPRWDPYGPPSLYTLKKFKTLDEVVKFLESIKNTEDLSPNRGNPVYKYKLKEMIDNFSRQGGKSTISINPDSRARGRYSQPTLYITKKPFGGFLVQRHFDDSAPWERTMQ